MPEHEPDCPGNLHWGKRPAEECCCTCSLRDRYLAQPNLRARWVLRAPIIAIILIVLGALGFGYVLG